jgi:hypothetical protein
MPHRSLKMKCETPVATGSSRSSLRLAPVLVIAASMAFCPTQMRADTIALSSLTLADIGAVFAVGGENSTLGWAFTLSSPVLVTQLGLWDGPGGDFSGPPGDGLLTSHVVTIWNSTGTQLAQATIPAGTSPTLTDSFRYVSIAPVLLPAGDYTIGGFYIPFTDVPPFSDLSAIRSHSITTASGVTYDGSRSVDGLSEEGLAFPPGDSLRNRNSYFGPNFQFTTPTSVPDTGTTCSLLGLSLTGLAFLRRKLC